MSDKIYLNISTDDRGQLTLKDQNGRELAGIAAMQILQSWNPNAPLGSGLEKGFGMISLNIIIKPPREEEDHA